MSLNPDNGQGYIFRGRAYAALSRWDEALEVSGQQCHVYDVK